jgi:hypothetical protein
MAFEFGAEPRQQRVERRRVIEIVRLVGETKARRVQHPHRFEGRPDRCVALEVCDVGGVRHLVEASRHILAHGTERGGDYEQAENDGAGDQAGASTRGAVVWRGRGI